MPNDSAPKSDATGITAVAQGVGSVCEKKHGRLYRCLLPFVVFPGYLVAVALVGLALAGVAPSIVTTLGGPRAVQAIGPMGAALVCILAGGFIFAATFVLHRAAKYIAEVDRRLDRAPGTAS